MWGVRRLFWSEDLGLIKKTVFVTADLEEKKEKHEQELMALQEKTSDLIATNSRQSQDQEAYNRQYQELVSQFH